MEENRKAAVELVDKIFYAMLHLSILCEKSPEMCEAISKVYPFDKSLDDVALDVCAWKYSLIDESTIGN